MKDNEIILENLEKELDELYSDLDAFEKQYEQTLDGTIKGESQFLINKDINDTKEQIAIKEEEIRAIKGTAR